MHDVPRMTKEELKEKIRRQDIQVIDVRQPKDYDQSDEKIIGAVREDPNGVDGWKDRYPARSQLLLYCA